MFDNVFGVIPAVLTGLYCLIVIFISATHLTWTAVRWIPVKYLFVLSLFGLQSCVFLVFATLNNKTYRNLVRTWCVLALWSGMIGIAVVIALCLITVLRGFGHTLLVLAWPLVFVLPLSLAAIKQISLLKTSKIGRRT